MKLRLKQRGRAIIAFICSLVLVLSVVSANATDKESLESQTSNLQNQLTGINQELLSISAEISTAEMQIKITDSEIQRTKDSLADVEENEAAQYDDMKTRIKYMYETGNATLLEMLFSAENMTDFLNKADFIQNISKYDRDMLVSLQETQKQIKDKKETMEMQQASMKTLQKDLKRRQDELVAKANATSTDLNAFHAQLEQLRADEAAKLAAEAAAKLAAAEEATRLASANNNNNNNSNNNNNNAGGSNGGIINGGSTNVSGNELDVFAAILQCEAYQDYTSLLAVATVIMNRVESSRFPNSITDVVYASGQFEPVWSGRLDKVLSEGPTSLSYQVAQDAINGSRLADVIDCYYFLYAGTATNEGINIGNNLFFASW